MIGSWAALLVIFGGVALSVGFRVGARAAEVVLARRERRVAGERKIVNALWHELDQRFDIDREVIMADHRDRESTV